MVATARVTYSCASRVGGIARSTRSLRELHVYFNGSTCLRGDGVDVPSPERDCGRGGGDESTGGVVDVDEPGQGEAILTYRDGRSAARSNGAAREHGIRGVDYLHRSTGRRNRDWRI